MTETAIPRRTFIGWMTSSMVLPIAANSMNGARFLDAAAPELTADQIFAGHVPTQAKQVITRVASGVFVSVYELRTEEAAGSSGFSTQRWLCIASEGDDGKLAIQTSGQALYGSDNWRPTDVFDVKILASGDVEVGEQLLRGSTTTRWSRSGNNWELAAMRESGVSAHRLYDVHYDRERRELVEGIGGTVDSDDPYEYTRHPVTETFTLADYRIKSMVDHTPG